MEARLYRSDARHERLRKRALVAWGVAMVLVGLLPGTAALAPALVSQGYYDIGGAVYKFFSFLCHQQAERSYLLLGNPIAVCARCFGVYFGLFIGFFIYPMFRRIDDVEPPSKLWLLLSLIPIGLDWTLGFCGILENTHLSRFATGTILGIACSIYLIPAFVDVAKHR